MPYTKVKYGPPYLIQPHVLLHNIYTSVAIRKARSQQEQGPQKFQWLNVTKVYLSLTQSRLGPDNSLQGSFSS